MTLITSVKHEVFYKGFDIGHNYSRNNYLVLLDGVDEKSSTIVNEYHIALVLHMNLDF